MKSALHRFGLILALTAMVGVFLHGGHRDAGLGEQPGEHCCLCHTASLGPTASAEALTPLSFIFELVSLVRDDQPEKIFPLIDSPRGPPFL